MNIKLIAAASFNAVIGKNNTLAWGHEYSEDMKYFREQTANSTIIMGKNTYESIGRPLPKRRNIVLSRKLTPKFDVPGTETFLSLEDALKTCENQQVWIIGGAQIYQEGLRYATELHITTIPETIDGDGLVYLPYINPDIFDISKRITLSQEKNLYCNVFTKKSKSID